MAYFPELQEDCADCHQPTRYWLTGAQMPLCPGCCEKRNKQATATHPVKSMGSPSSERKDIMEWKDTSSYKRGDTVRQPTCWTIEDPKKLLRVVVVHGHVHAPGHWCFHCAALGFDTVELLSVPQSPEAADQAKAEALHWVLDRLRDMSSVAAEMVRAAWPPSKGGERHN